MPKATIFAPYGAQRTIAKMWQAGLEPKILASHNVQQYDNKAKITQAKRNDVLAIQSTATRQQRRDNINQRESYSQSTLAPYDAQPYDDKDEVPQAKGNNTCAIWRAANDSKDVITQARTKNTRATQRAARR